MREDNLKMRIVCPHCGLNGKITHTDTFSSQLKEVYVNCQNPECGARFVTSVSYRHDIVPPKNTLIEKADHLLASLPEKEIKKLLTKYTSPSKQPLLLV